MAKQRKEDSGVFPDAGYSNGAYCTIRTPFIHHVPCDVYMTRRAASGLAVETRRGVCSLVYTVQPWAMGRVPFPLFGTDDATESTQGSRVLMCLFIRVR